MAASRAGLVTLPIYLSTYLNRDDAHHRMLGLVFNDDAAAGDDKKVWLYILSTKEKAGVIAHTLLG